MFIPISIFYYLYLVLAAIFLLLSLITIYHLVKYSKMDLVSLVIIFFYLAIAIIIFTLSWGYTSKIDWKQTISILSGFEKPQEEFEL